MGGGWREKVSDICADGTTRCWWWWWGWFRIKIKQEFFFLKQNKMIILLSCSCVITTVWLHHSDFNVMPTGKSRWEIHKDVACCFEHILEAAFYKTAAVQSPPISQTIKVRQLKRTGNGWRSKDELISNVQCTHTHRH